MGVSWERAEERYDAWRTGTPQEPRYGWDDFAAYIEANPECGWDPDDEDDLTEYIDMMNDAIGEAAADRAEARQGDDDRAYWGTL
jgi:hypothetical protein